MITITSRPSWNIKGITTSTCIPINLFTRIQHHFTYLKPRSVFLSKTRCDGAHFIENKTHTTENKDAPRITHNAWSNKNIAHWKMTWCFLLMKRGCLGHPQALTLVLLGYFLGWPWGHPQAWAFVHSSSYCIILLSLHLKTSFTQNSSQFSLAALVQ